MLLRLMPAKQPCVARVTLPRNPYDCNEVIWTRNVAFDAIRPSTSDEIVGDSI